MKYIIAIIILFVTLIIAVAISSCSRYCEPTNIESGKSLQHHDLKKFRATYFRQGNFYVITYRNMQEERKVITDCRPPFKSGTWTLIVQ